MEETTKPKPIGPIEFDLQGDLVFLVGELQDRFVVCSRTMARSSNVFRKMLFGGFSESKPEAGSEWTVTLPEDDASAFKPLLNIAHGRFGEVPQTVSPDDLFEILVVSEKYDMTAIVRPWANSWFPFHNRMPTKQTWAGDTTTFLAVSLELGAKGAFSMTAKALLLQCFIDDSGNLLGPRTGKSMEFSPYLEPRGLLGMKTPTPVPVPVPVPVLVPVVAPIVIPVAILAAIPCRYSRRCSRRCP